MSKTKQPRLGRGLSTLMARPVDVGVSTAGQDKSEQPNPEVVQLMINTIRPNPNQPRQTLEPKGISQLAESIRMVGVMQPIIVRPDSQGGHQLVAGERRWRAAQMAGLSHVPAVVQNLEDDEAAYWALVENLQREDLNPIDRAQGFANLINRFSMSHDQVAGHVGIERSSVSNSLRLLTLNPDVQTLVAHGALSAGIAKVLAGVPDDPQQLQLAKQVVNNAWSVRQLEAAVRKGAASPPQRDSAEVVRSRHITDLEQQIGQQLQTKIRINPGRKKGTGTLSVEFYSFEQFDALMDRLGVETE